MSRLPEIPVSIGHQVEDIVTGVKGIATAVTFYLSGTIQVHVQPKAESPDKMPDAWAIDVEQLRVVENGEHVLDRVTVADTPLVALGEDVEDTMTGFRGKVFGLTVCFNGCIRALVVAKAAKSSAVLDGRPAEINVDHKHLKSKGRGLSTPEPKASEPPVRRTGCLPRHIPANRAPRAGR